MSSQIIKLIATPATYVMEADELEPSMFSSSVPKQHSYMAYENDDIGLYVGIWDTTDMVEAPGPYPCDEYMVLLEGTALIQHNQTSTDTEITTNQSFVIPKGLDCQWHQSGYLRKFFVIWQHPELDLPTTPSVDRILIDGEDYQDHTKQFHTGMAGTQHYSSAQAPHPYYEFIYVKHGKLTISGHSTCSLNAGEAAFISKGTRCQFDSSSDLTAEFVRVSS